MGEDILHTYYSLLEVQKSASQEDIRRAYRRLAMAFHPDVNPGTDAEDRFKAIGQAYSVLGDPEKRRLYDRTGDAQPSAGPYQRPVTRPAPGPCMGKCSGLDALFRRRPRPVFPENADRQIPRTPPR